MPGVATQEVAASASCCPAGETLEMETRSWNLGGLFFLLTVVLQTEMKDLTDETILFL